MKCSSALSTAPATSKAFHEILEHLELKSAGECTDLIMVFASMHHADELGRISLALKEKGLARHVLGCTGESIVGEDSEVEGSPALSVWSITAPGLTLRPIRMEGPAEASLPWADGLQDVEHAVLLFLGDPFSFEPDEFLKQVNSQVTGLRVVGGMASGSQVPRANQLVLDGEAFHDGAVAMLLGGPVSVRTVVSQGCRPIGHTMLITKAEQNIIRELGRRPALEVLREMFQELSEDDQRRASRRTAHRSGDQRIPGFVPAGRLPGPQRDRSRRLGSYSDHRPGSGGTDRSVPCQGCGNRRRGSSP